jgi:hypothetical protein
VQFVERTVVLSESFLSKILLFRELEVQNYDVYGYTEIREFVKVDGGSCF